LFDSWEHNLGSGYLLVVSGFLNNN
jgi:hypothetical protein